MSWVASVITAVGNLGGSIVNLAAVNKQTKTQREMLGDQLGNDLILAGMGAEAQRKGAENMQETLVIGAVVLVVIIIVVVVGLIMLRKFKR